MLETAVQLGSGAIGVGLRHGDVASRICLGVQAREKGGTERVPTGMSLEFISGRMDQSSWRTR
jgi:hypothetical protein